MWLTREAKEFFINQQVCHSLHFVPAYTQSKELRNSNLQPPDLDTLLSNVLQLNLLLPPHTQEINPLTCILTAIDKEFSSLSSSLRTTSFFSVRLQSLWEKKNKKEGGEEKKQISGINNTM